MLAHELAHTLLGHQAEDLSSQHVEDVLAAIPLTVISAVCPSPLAATAYHWLFNRCLSVFVDKPFSRETEREADRVRVMDHFNRSH